MKKLAIITTHPIQYNAPWFRLLAERKRVEVKVFYTWSQVQNEEKFDPGFGKVVEWDIPLLDGYEYTFVKNISKNPGSKTYKGIDNPTLIEEINLWKPNAILIFGWKFKSHLKALKYYHNKIPVLFRGDSNLLNHQKGIKRIIRNRLLGSVYKNVNYALYVGSENRKYYETAGLNKHQLIFAPHAVDNARFKRAAGEENSFRKRLVFDDHAIVFLFAGKFELIKNPMLLLSVADKFQNTNVHFVFAGNGPLEAQMKKSTNENIHFLDFQNQSSMPELYSICDVFVLPSLNETWGLAVNEAMACGKPVIVSDRCGCATDLVEDGVTGYVFKSTDEEDLTNKIACMIDQKDVLKKMGKSAFERIQGWSFEKIAEAVEEVVSGSSQ